MTERTDVITVTLAARRLNISEPTFRRRVRESELPIYTDPRDRRRRLVRTADVDRLDTLERLTPVSVREVA